MPKAAWGMVLKEWEIKQEGQIEGENTTNSSGHMYLWIVPHWGVWVTV